MTPKTLQQIHSNLSTLRGDNPAFVGGNTLKGRAAVGRGGGVGRWWSAATLAGLLALIGQFIAPSASAQTIYYWDCNTNTAGFGAAQGTWSATTAPGATQGWSTSAAGNIGLGSVLTALTDTSENFGNSSNGLTAGAVTISGAVSAGTNLVFGAASGAITLAGGTSITLPATATISVNNTKDIISTPLAGAASLLTLSAGNLVISNTALPASTYNIANGAILELTATTVNPLSAGVTFTNSGTLKLDGGSNGVINFSASATVNMQLAAGGLVQVSSNTTVTGSSGYHGIWSANHSSLTVDSGSVLNFVETGSNTAGAAAQFDGLNGGGVISMGYLTYRTLSLGNNNGNGAYSGAINDANTGNGSTTAVVKNGTGTQILSGNSGFTAGTTINNGVLEADSNTALGGGW